MKLPPLFKKTSTGADQTWQISVKGSTITTVYGQVGGKMQTATDVIKVGKNVGKSNETTPEEQAMFEAQAQWIKKKTAKGYVESLGDARKGKRDVLVAGGIDPMLAHRFDEQGHKIVYPAFAQPKLDGHRCTAVVGEDAVTLWSRTRKPILSMPHIVAALEDLDLVRGTVLDGELYNRAYRNKFEELTHFIRSPGPVEGHEVVQYHIYDMAIDGTFESRSYGIRKLLRSLKKQSPLVEVETVTVDDEDDLTNSFDGFIAQGYEGPMVRNADSLYENKRSFGLQKVKEFQDSEFVVIGINEGRGKLAGHGIFVCRTDAGVEFAAKQTGGLEKLRLYYDRPDLVVGKKLTVKFQGYTATGAPRFPVALRLREDV